MRLWIKSSTLNWEMLKSFFHGQTSTRLQALSQGHQCQGKLSPRQALYCAAELDTLVKPLSYYLISCNVIQCKQTTSVICTQCNMRICRNKCVSLFALCNKKLDTICKIIFALSVLRLDVKRTSSRSAVLNQ